MSETRDPVGPGSPEELFDELEAWEFFSDRNDGEEASAGLFECDFEALQDVAAELWMYSPFRRSPFSDPFSFLASSSLSGAGDPCFNLPCRIDRALALSRFAALYGETVLIRDPFEPVLYGEDSRKLRLDFAHTLVVLRVLRPALEAGVVAFGPADFSFCESHLKVFRAAEERIQEKVFGACSLLLPGVVADLDVGLQTRDDYTYLSIGGTEKFVPHAGIDLLPLPGSSQWTPEQELSPDEVSDAVQTFVLDPSVIDLQYRLLLNWLLNARYLTDRPVDADLLSLMDAVPQSAQPPRFRPKISHELPYIDGLDTKTLLKLRRDEGEAFNVYRDRVRQLVEDASLSESEFREAFRDLVEPELHKIEKAVATAKKMVRGSVREKLVFGAGLATVGLAAGTVSPEAGAVLSALGGGHVTTELLSSLNRLLREPEEALTSDFYFLWRARDGVSH